MPRKTWRTFLLKDPWLLIGDHLIWKIAWLGPQLKGRIIMIRVWESVVNHAAKSANLRINVVRSMDRIVHLFLIFLLITIRQEWFYLILCRTCGKVYVGNTITSFRKRFNNHMSSMIRYSKGRKEKRVNMFILIFLKMAIKELRIWEWRL